jgi:DNA polymerase III delta prime subunit
MEIYSNTTRFALACNMSNKIIEPIQSRCAILRYAKLRDSEVLKRLLEICKLEDVRRLLSEISESRLSSLSPRRYRTRTKDLQP